jgi:hypothetical protein
MMIPGALFYFPIILRLHDENLTIDYFDDAALSGKHLLLTEKWVMDCHSGILTGLSITDHTLGYRSGTGVDRLTHFQASLEKAIGG